MSERIEYLFPSALYINDSMQEHTKKILPLAKQYLTGEDNLYEVDGYQTTYHNQELCDAFMLEPPVVDFMNEAMVIGDRLLSHHGYDVAQMELRPWGFVSKMEKGGHHARHCHPNCTLSGILYLDVADEDEDTAKITFHDPRQQCLLVKHPISDHNNPLGWGTATFTPKTGSMLLWQSWWEHSVNIHKSESDRYTFVFNM